MRVPAEVAGFMLADDLDHLAHDGIFHIAVRTGIDFDQLARGGAAGSARNLTFGFDPSKSGGIFQVTRMSIDHGEFLFHGWNMDIGRNTQQLIEVRRGNASDIRLAIVRKMIEIIRQHEPVEFVWESDRLGRALTLSSRLRDSAGLEDFMLQEFFSLKR